MADKGFKLHPQGWRLEDALLRAYERDGYDEKALAICQTCQSDLLHRFALALPQAQSSVAAGLLLRLLHAQYKAKRNFIQELPFS